MSSKSRTSGPKGGVWSVQKKVWTLRNFRGKFFWGAEISTPIFENFHLWDFFSKNLILPQTSNQPKIAANTYFWLRLKYVVHPSKICFLVQKFLSEISTGVRNFCRILVKIQKNDFSWIEILGRNFCRMTEISAKNRSLDIMSKHIFNMSTGYNQLKSYEILNFFSKMAFLAKNADYGQKGHF